VDVRGQKLQLVDNPDGVPGAARLGGERLGRLLVVVGRWAAGVMTPSEGTNSV
jgi:hypothetical protein